jgi:hypothetical protein
MYNTHTFSYLTVSFLLGNTGISVGKKSFSENNILGVILLLLLHFYLRVSRNFIK